MALRSGVNNSVHHASSNNASSNHGSPKHLFTVVTLRLKSKRMKESVKINDSVFSRHKITKTTRPSKTFKSSDKIKRDHRYQAVVLDDYADCSVYSFGP